MRLNGSSNGSTRSSALWGKPSKGETRSSALWGKGGRGFMVALVIAISMAMPLVAVAGVLQDYRHDDLDQGVPVARASRRREGAPECDVRRHRPGEAWRHDRPGGDRRQERPRERPRQGRGPAQELPLAERRRGAAHRRADPQARQAHRHRRDHAGCTGRPLQLQPPALAVRGRLPQALEHAGGRQRTGDRRRRLRHRVRSLRLRHPHRREREPLVPSGQLGRRRARSRHLRGGHRGGQREPLRRRLARIQDRLHRRDGRQRAWP